MKRTMKPVTTSDGHWTLPAGVDLAAAMTISKRDAVIRLACAIQHGQMMRKWVAESLLCGAPLIGTVAGNEFGEKTWVYRMPGGGIAVNDGSGMLSTFDGPAEAVAFYAGMGMAHNRAIGELIAASEVRS